MVEVGQGERLHAPVGIRFSDLDAYGHVNNVATLRFFEEARVQVFWSGDAFHDGAAAEELLPTAVLADKPGEGTLTVLAHQEIEYLESIPYLRAPLDIQLWFGRLGGASLQIFYEVHSPRSSAADVLYARAETTLVLVDAATMKPRRISAEERAAWQPYTGEPLEFSRRRR